VLTLGAVLISCIQIFMHLRCNKTKLWMCTCRILAIVPIYSLNAWGCLMLEGNDFRLAELLTFMREVYESLAIVSFMQFMLTFLSGPKRLAEELAKKEEPFQHPLPMRWLLPKYRPGPHFVSCIVLGVLQYIPVMFAIFVTNAVFWILSKEDLDSIWLQRLTLIPKLLKAGSCAVAMYHLALFYSMVREQLKEIRPILKFLGIKGIVFFTFWQELVITILVRCDVIPHQDKINEEELWGQIEIADGIKNFLLCGEMFFFAELHRRAYPFDPYEELTAEKGPHMLLRSPSLDVTTDTPRASRRAYRIPFLNDLIDLHREVVHLRQQARSEDLAMLSSAEAGDEEDLSDGSSSDMELDLASGLAKQPRSPRESALSRGSSTSSLASDASTEVPAYPLQGA